MKRNFTIKSQDSSIATADEFVEGVLNAEIAAAF
jgi:hypothetical protein